MLFKIKDIGDEGLDVDLPVTAAWLGQQCPDLGAGVGADGLALRGVLERSGDDVLLRGDLRGTLETSCGRCLEGARVEVDVPVTVTFVEKGAAGDRDVDADDDDDIVFFEGGEIDLGAEVRDEILLAMPLNPLCREGCLGLCAVCGGNRNHAPCDCEERQRAVTSKLSALGRIKLQ
ncbi:MAG TPA: DUF177 domain-containing protein [Polyangia bacterium]|jgi:uncharacterized protein|nr:DUF177 domain-containing protein [Polyangia bacterium]